MTGESGGTDGGWRPPSVPSASGADDAIAGYTDLVEVGRGGDSVVYRARQMALARDVAIKVLLVDDEQRAARFRREVEITVDLGRQHPNIVNVLDIGTTSGGRPYLVMDFVEAGTVHDRLRAQGPLPAHEVVEIGYVLADALAFAHAHGILHRDVKPQNILVLPTSWVLADFGIARAAGSEHTASVETFTYRHAAPQILDGLRPSAADDLWSLGSTLYTLLDGRPPFASDDPDDESALGYIRRARTEPHRPLRGDDAADLAPIIDRCLAKRVEDRFASAGELRDAFAGLRATAWKPGGAPSSPGPATTPPLPAPPVPAPPVAADAPDPTARRDAVAAPAPAQPAVEPAPGPAAASVAPPTPVQPAPATPGWAPGADPEPIALSVLAHAPVQTERSDDHTGTSPAPARGAVLTSDGAGASGAAGAGAPPSTAAGPEVPGEPRRRRRPLLLLGVLALVIGLGLGIVGNWLRSPEPAPEPEPSAAGVPTVTEAPVEPPDLTRRPNPDLEPAFRTLRDVGLDLELAWTDPSEGDGSFIVARTSGGGLEGAEYLARVPAGTTSFTLPGAAAAEDRRCYALLLIMPDGSFGVSRVRCWSPGAGADPSATPGG